MRRGYLPGLFVVTITGCMTLSPFNDPDSPAAPDEVITIVVSSGSSTPGTHFERVEWTFHPNGDCRRERRSTVSEWNNPSDYQQIARLIRVWNLLDREKRDLMPGSHSTDAWVKAGDREGHVSYYDGDFRPLKIRRLFAFLGRLEEEHDLPASLVRK